MFLILYLYRIFLEFFRIYIEFPLGTTNEPLDMIIIFDEKDDLLKAVNFCIHAIRNLFEKVISK